MLSEKPFTKKNTPPTKPKRSTDSRLAKGALLAGMALVGERMIDHEVKRHSDTGFVHDAGSRMITDRATIRMTARTKIENMMDTHELDRYLGRPDLFVTEFKSRMREMLRIQEGDPDAMNVMDDAFVEMSNIICDEAKASFEHGDIRRSVQLSELSGDETGAFEASLQANDPRGALESLDRIIDAYHLIREDVYSDLVLGHPEQFESVIPYISSQNISFFRAAFPRFIGRVRGEITRDQESIQAYEHGGRPYWSDETKQRTAQAIERDQRLLEQLLRMQTRLGE